MLRRRMAAAIVGVSAAMLGLASPASAADRPWGMTGVISGFESSYWDTGSGVTTIRVDSCGTHLNYGATYSSMKLELWENLAWQPDINRGSRSYVCAANGGRTAGGNGQWTHSNGRFYFRLASTPYNGYIDANGNTHYPG